MSSLVSEGIGQQGKLGKATSNTKTKRKPKTEKKKRAPKKKAPLGKKVQKAQQMRAGFGFRFSLRCVKKRKGKGAAGRSSISTPPTLRFGFSDFFSQTHFK